MIEFAEPLPKRTLDEPTTSLTVFFEYGVIGENHNLFHREHKAFRAFMFEQILKTELPSMDLTKPSAVNATTVFAITSGMADFVCHDGNLLVRLHGWVYCHKPIPIAVVAEGRVRTSEVLFVAINGYANVPHYFLDSLEMLFVAHSFDFGFVFKEVEANTLNKDVWVPLLLISLLDFRRKPLS